MAIQFQKVLHERDESRAELSECHKIIKKLSEQNDLKTRTIFGRATEKMLDMLDEAVNPAEEFEDESQTEDNGTSQEDSSKVTNFEDYLRRKEREAQAEEAKNNNSGKVKGDKGSKKSRNMRLKKSIDGLPSCTEYDMDVELLNALYGEYNWRIANWHEHCVIEKVECPIYVRKIYTPVISYGLEHLLETVPYQNLLLDRSYLSSSFVADFFYRKYALSLPMNRQAADYQMQGLDVSKQDLIVWTNKIAPKVMWPVWNYLQKEQQTYGYENIDESPIQVNRDGRAPGSKSYMWVHVSGALLDRPPIILFCYEPTRGTDHLRIMLAEFKGYITCDAYISYQVVEQESDGSITTTGCMMHCRRYFAIALFINDLKSMTEEQIMDLPETKVLILIREIYREENQLKDMPADDRLKAREQFVAPKVNALFAYIHELLDSGEVFSDKLQKAISYAINQEECLRRFLTDGNIPIDNGSAERAIRSFSVGRSNWLFVDTIKGAEVTALMYSIVETAKANSVNVYLYLKYLFEEVPKHLNADGSLKDEDFLPDMMPWSDAYHRYEAGSLENRAQMYRSMFPVPEAPKAPRKKQASPPKDTWQNSA
ncbi:MAG: IS66 family transposase [Butyrivibrio sp.]|uniref:IS66 family transposase n=1 Tax=Butyrivibrio sp. TaxID=28121 RepID=UPI001B2F78D2|nr:IS66 family transposase [Butyrivibrio sp.]MBO6240308.1 IS66 family transposase [Butyrivibrio sp.]